MTDKLSLLPIVAAIEQIFFGSWYWIKIKRKRRAKVNKSRKKNKHVVKENKETKGTEPA